MPHTCFLQLIASATIGDRAYVRHRHSEAQDTLMQHVPYQERNTTLTKRRTDWTQPADSSVAMGLVVGRSQCVQGLAGKRPARS